MHSGKVYRGAITLGMAYDSEDLDGKLIEQVPIQKPVTNEEIDQALAKLTGDIMQTPPMYSAVKVNGHKLYEYARKGMTIEREPHPIHIDYFKQLNQQLMMKMPKPRPFISKSAVQKALMSERWRLILGKYWDCLL